MKKIIFVSFMIFLIGSSLYILNEKSIFKMGRNAEPAHQYQSKVIDTAPEDNLQLDNQITEINESQYVGFINDLYENPNDYEGYPFRIRGHYRTREIDGVIHHYIFQGTDERWVGLEITYDEDYPVEGSIIQVVGIIKVTPNNKPYFELSTMTFIEEGHKL